MKSRFSSLATAVVTLKYFVILDTREQFLPIFLVSFFQPTINVSAYTSNYIFIEQKQWYIFEQSS